MVADMFFSAHSTQPKTRLLRPSLNDTNIRLRREEVVDVVVHGTEPKHGHLYQSAHTRRLFESTRSIVRYFSREKLRFR